MLVIHYCMRMELHLTSAISGIQDASKCCKVPVANGVEYLSRKLGTM